MPKLGVGVGSKGLQFGGVIVWREKGVGLDVNREVFQVGQVG
jgi:hypothetical protein